MKSDIGIVRGVCPVLSAVFHDSGEVDLEGFRAMCRHVLGTGVSSVMIFGVATENAKLTDDERESMLRVLVSEREGLDLTIVATVADHSTQLASARATRWVELGADAINILPSYFLTPAHTEILHHLETILEAVSTPVIVQSLPSGGNELPLADIVGLAHAHPNLTQIKVEDIPASASVAGVIAASEGRVSALVGWGGLEWREATAAGALGVQPGCSLTELYLRAQRYLDAGDTAGFSAAFEPLREPLKTWMRHPEVLIAIEKHILQQRGIIASSATRRPSAALTTNDYELAGPLIALAEGSDESAL